MTIHSGQSFQITPTFETIVVKTGVQLYQQGKLIEELHYPEAALWDFASRHYRFRKICELMSHITDLADVSSFVSDTLTLWVKRGYLRTKELASV